MVDDEEFLPRLSEEVRPSPCLFDPGVPRCSGQLCPSYVPWQDTVPSPGIIVGHSSYCRAGEWDLEDGVCIPYVKLLIKKIRLDIPG